MFRSTAISLILITTGWLAAQTGSVLEAGLAEARQLRSQGRTEQALQKLTGLLSTTGLSANPAIPIELLQEMAGIYTERNEPAKAAACLEDALTRAPKDGAVHYRLGLAYREMGENRKAAAQFQSAVENGFRNLAVSFHLAAALFASRQSTAALETAAGIIAAAPRAPDLLLRLGRLLFDHLYYREALDAFRLAHNLQPEAFEPGFYLALTHYLLNQYAPAIEVLAPMAQSRSNPEVANLLAASEAASGNEEKASRLLSETIAQAPRNPHAYLNLAFLKLEQAQPHEAEKLLQQFRALEPQQDAKVFYSVKGNSCPVLLREIRDNQDVHAAPETAAFYFDLASQMQARYHHSTAVELLRLARHYEGNTGRLLYAAGMSCLNLSSPAPEAVPLLREAVASNPANYQAWYLLGRAYQQQGNTDQALAAFRRAITIEPRAPCLIALGKAVQSLESLDKAEAQAAFEQAIALEPSNALAYYELGRFFSQRDQFDKARTHLMRAVELEPEFYEAYYALGRLCARAGYREESQKYLALFERTKRAALEQSVAGSGYIAEGRER